MTNSQKYQGCSFLRRYNLVDLWLNIWWLVGWFVGEIWMKIWKIWTKIWVKNSVSFLCRFCDFLKISENSVKIWWFLRGPKIWKFLKNLWKKWHKCENGTKMAQKWHTILTVFWLFLGVFWGILGYFWVFLRYFWWFFRFVSFLCRFWYFLPNLPLYTNFYKKYIISRKNFRILRFWHKNGTNAIFGVFLGIFC